MNGFAQRCAIGKGKFVINVTTNGSGNACVMLTPRAPSLINFAYNHSSDPGYNPTTGTGTPTPVAGPLNVNAVIRNGYIIGSAVNV